MFPKLLNYYQNRRDDKGSPKSKNLSGLEEKMKTTLKMLSMIVLATGMLHSQDQAHIQVARGQTDHQAPTSFRPGAPITFDVTLNEPMPKGAHFDLRISPAATDQEVPLGSGEPLDGSGRKFRVKGKLPEGALPGEWRISVIWLFLSGTSWTHNTLAHDNVSFKVEGEPYVVPTKAEVKVAH